MEHEMEVNVVGRAACLPDTDHQERGWRIGTAWTRYSLMKIFGTYCSDEDYGEAGFTTTSSPAAT